MLKLKLNEIRNMGPVLTKLAQQDLPIAVAFRLEKMITEIDTHYSSIEKYRSDLVNKYGTKVKVAIVDGQEKVLKEGESVLDDPDVEFTEKIEVLPENLQFFYNELGTLFDEEVSLLYEPISISVFDKFPDVSLSARDVAIIKKLFIE